MLDQWCSKMFQVSPTGSPSFNWSDLYYTLNLTKHRWPRLSGNRDLNAAGIYGENRQRRTASEDPSLVRDPLHNQVLATHSDFIRKARDQGVLGGDEAYNIHSLRSLQEVPYRYDLRVGLFERFEGAKCGKHHT